MKPFEQPEKKQRQRVDWEAEANCLTSKSNIFFPENRGRPRKTPAYKSVCGSCPVVYECLNYAIVHDEKGTWGGYTENDRARLVKYFPIFVSDLKSQAAAEGWLEKHPSPDEIFNQKSLQTDLFLEESRNPLHKPDLNPQPLQQATGLTQLDSALEWFDSL